MALSKLWTIIAVAVLGTVSWLLPREIIFMTRPPTLEMSETEFAFGAVDPGTMVSHSFSLENSGGGILKILRVMPSCSCTVAHISKTELRSGERADITINLDTTNQFGDVHKQIAVISNAPKQSTLGLNIDGQVRFAFSPESKMLEFHWNKGHGKQNEVFNVELAGRAKDAMLAVDPATVPGYLDLKLERLDPIHYRVECQLNCAAAPNSFSNTVFLHAAGGSLCPRYPIYISGALADALKSIPNVLYYGVVKPGCRYSRKVTIYGPPDMINNILSKGPAKVSCLGVVATMAQDAVIASDSSRALTVTIDVNASVPIGKELNGELLLGTDNISKLAIPLVGYVR